MIELRHVTKTYRALGRRRVVLDDVSAIFPDGRAVAVFGANGQGKSTLIRLLAGTEAPDSGRVLHTGRTSFPLGFSGTFNALLSGRENIRFLARLHGADTTTTLGFVEDFAELGAYWRMPVGTYSSGMLARLAFGACIALEFDTYLVDEVISVGDARFRARCLDAFAARTGHAALVLVSHDLAIARAFCDSGAVLAGAGLRMFDEIEDAIALHETLVRGSERSGEIP